MMQEMSEFKLIKTLPGTIPYRQQIYPSVTPRPQQPQRAGGTQDKYMCKDFQRTGKCDWEARTGKKCRFSHSTAKVMMAQLSTAEMDVRALQNTLNDMDLYSKEMEGKAMPKPDFKMIYDVAYSDTGTPKFSTTHNELVMMLAQEITQEEIRSDSDDDDLKTAQQAIDGWHL